MSVHEILHPKNWKPTPGYANGIAARGRTLYLGGLMVVEAEREF